jgi:hypothetical protein
VYEGLLEHYSAYIKTALKKEWSGEANKTLELPQDDPKTFCAFFSWLFSGKLYPWLTDSGGIPLSFLEICGIYIFSDMRDIPKLRNAAINLMYQKVTQDCYSTSKCLYRIYNYTTGSDALRRFMVNEAVNTFNW